MRMKTLRRVVLPQALARLQNRTLEGRLVLKGDRVSRSVRDMDKLIEHDVRSGLSFRQSADRHTDLGGPDGARHSGDGVAKGGRDHLRADLGPDAVPESPGVGLMQSRRGWPADPRTNAGGAGGGAQRCGEGGRAELRWHLPPARLLVVPKRGGSIRLRTAYTTERRMASWRTTNCSLRQRWRISWG
jgi:hypothetical protein